MARPESPDTRDSPPWAAKRVAGGRHLVRNSLPWLGGTLLLALIGWGLWPKPVIIETGVVGHTELTTRVAEEGKTRIRNRYVVAAPVAGKMRRVTLKAGDPVEAGRTILTTIEPALPPLLDPRARAQARAVVALQEAAQGRAAQALEAARAGLNLAETERARMRSVKQPGTLSEADRDRMETEAVVKAAELRAAEFAVRVADHELAQARAVLERPAGELSNNTCEITTPVSGRLLKVLQESETMVAPGTPLVEVGDPEDIEIEAEILSRDAVTIHPGDAVDIDQWGGDHPLRGRVRRIEPAAFTKISALGVEEQRVIVLSDLVDVPEAAKALGDRYRVEVRIAIWHADRVLTVPSGALFREGNAWKTYIYQNGLARLAAVEAGHSDGNRTEILGGLKPGDKVLLHPPDVVKDGTRVKERPE